MTATSRTSGSCLSSMTLSGNSSICTQGDGKEWQFAVYEAKKRRLPASHPFFSGGNLERELLAKQVSLQISQDEMVKVKQEQEDLAYSICCPIVGCRDVLHSLADFDSHYATRHMATCSICRRCFPTASLLSIHVSETHDSFFKAKLARGHPMYECLVSNCQSRFHSDTSRLQHLIDRHHFPKSFSFNKKAHLSQKQRKKGHQRRKEHARAEQNGENRVNIEDEGGSIGRKEHGGLPVLTEMDPGSALQPLAGDHDMDEADTLGARDSSLQCSVRDNDSDVVAQSVHEVQVMMKNLQTSDLLKRRGSSCRPSAGIPENISFGRRRGRGTMFAPSSRGQGGSPGMGDRGRGEGRGVGRGKNLAESTSHGP